jgi:plastocyanin
LRPAFHAIAALLASGAACAAPLQLQLLDVRGAAVAGTVVTLRSTDTSRPVLGPVQAKMDQVDLRFEPHVLVVPRGSKIEFPNSDEVPHQVYSNSDAKEFELELYSGKARPAVEFPRRGVVSVGCNVHDLMRAYIYVVEAH